MKLPLAPFERILKEQGAERVTAEAVEELRKEVENYAVAVAEFSIAMSHHAGRKTVNKADIRISVR